MLNYFCCWRFLLIVCTSIYFFNQRFKVIINNVSYFIWRHILVKIQDIILLEWHYYSTKMIFTNFFMRFFMIFMIFLLKSFPIFFFDGNFIQSLLCVFISRLIFQTLSGWNSISFWFNATVAAYWKHILSFLFIVILSFLSNQYMKHNVKICLVASLTQ